MRLLGFIFLLVIAFALGARHGKALKSESVDRALANMQQRVNYYARLLMDCKNHCRGVRDGEL